MSDLGNEKIFAKNLKHYMEINNKTRYDVCKDLNLAYTTFAEWYNGKIYPRIDKIEMLANYFNIKKSDLIEDKTKTDILGNPVAPVPLLGSVKAGYNYLAQENWIGTVDVEKSLVGDGKDYFALKVKGDSMAPVFIENDIVIIKRQSDCENNEYAVVIINGDEGTLKKIKKTDNGIILQPLNPAYRTCYVH
jgi:hypothetical protein